MPEPTVAAVACVEEWINAHQDTGLAGAVEEVEELDLIYRVQRALDACEQRVWEEVRPLMEAVDYLFTAGPGVAVPEKYEHDMGEPHRITWNKKLDALTDALARARAAEAGR